MQSSLKEKTAKGLLWGAVNNGAQQVLVLVFGIVLARLLSPEEYGMVGLLTLFTLMGNTLQESGFRAALVNLKHIRHEDYNAVFWCSLCIGCIAYAVLFGCAPFIARFYGEPALVPLARYCFLAIPIASLGTAQGAWLYRNLQVKQQAFSGIIAHIVSGCTGIVLALYGFSYWGIATQSLTYLVVVTLCTWHYSPWRPTLPVDFSPIRPLFAFSSKLLITNIANHLNNNLLSVLLGKFFSTPTVGNFNQANKWNGTGHQFITGMLNSVAQPVLATVREDRERASQVFRKILRFTAFLSFPALFGLSSVTRELVLLTVGEKWTDSIPMMQLLCLGGAFIPFTTLFSSLIISQGRSDLYMRNILSQVVLQLCIVLAVIVFGGSIYTLIASYVCLSVGWLCVWQYFARRFIDLSFPLLVRDLLPFLLSAASACCLGVASSQWTGENLLASFAVKVIVTAGCYLLFQKILHADVLDECIDYLLKKKRP